ncbi:MAG: NAD(P)/FAD-dependent oxidoreductase [Clostridia bacterium]|nr:NAD(P)/FAD-dependent oxidoreductase [Clostridia bacterium]
MSRIVVAGAGHGGLTAAYNLAKAGHSVEVFEKNAEENTGHEWTDGVSMFSFDKVGMPRPDLSLLAPNKDMVFYNPKKTVTLELEYPKTPDFGFIERRELIKFLVSQCRQAGVVFHFETPVLSAVCGEQRVRGIKIESENKQKTVFADLVIDAAGMDSPVRKSLPERFGIPNEIPDKDAFFVYRGLYQKTDDSYFDPRYKVYFFHCGHPGMDWMITEEDCMDVLIGQFGGIGEKEIEEGLADFREEYPYLGDKLLRGGYVSKIPLTRTLPKMVCSGYAAVGDSAGMTVPLNGCGIDLSMRAGGILARAVSGVTDGDYNERVLWRYQTLYCIIHGNSLVIVSALRAFLSTLKARNIDFLMEKEILSQAEIGMANGSMSGVDFFYIMKKLKAILPQAYLVPAAAKALRGVIKLKKISTCIPGEFSEKKLSAWRKIYESI